MLIVSTHFLSGVLSIFAWKRSGHSHTPVVSPAGPNSLNKFHCNKFFEPYNCTLCSGESIKAIIHFFVGSCQKTFGSRKSFLWISRTGLFAYFVHVFPSSKL